MTNEQVELELRLHMGNLCLAVLSKKESMLRECKELLVAKVCELMAKPTEPTEEMIRVAIRVYLATSLTDLEWMRKVLTAALTAAECDKR